MDDLGNEFLALHAMQRATLGVDATHLLDQLVELRPCESGCREFANLGTQVVGPLTRAAALPDAGERRSLSRALIAYLAADAVERIAERTVTSEIIARAGRWRETLLDYLRGDDQEDYWFPNDLFLKDYRFVTAITVPCGAQVVDLADGIGPKTALKLGLAHPRLVVRALQRPWFQIHTEARYLDEFNDAGWTKFYHTAVALLKINPHIQGIVGTSWFYDPALGIISPRLAYLRDYPVAHGAVSVKQGTTAFDIKSATATSETRRQLFAEGRYQPTCHTIIWPREAMIAWDANPDSV